MEGKVYGDVAGAGDVFSRASDEASQPGLGGFKHVILVKQPMAELDFVKPRTRTLPAIDNSICTTSGQYSSPLLPSTSETTTMAASIRPTLMRHALAAPAQRTLTTSALPAFRVQRTQPILRSIPRATFQTSTARKILPPLPQVMKGSVNDAASVPEAHPAHGSYHWSFERCDIGGDMIWMFWNMED